VVDEDPREILRSHGLHVTSQRVAVLATVREHPHSTADDVYAVVHDMIGTVSRQTVYDSLSSLADRGIVRRIEPAGSAVRYEGRVGDNHHHLICRECRRVVDIDCAVGETPCLTAADDAGFAIDEAEVVYWGICPDCASRQAGDRGGQHRSRKSSTEESATSHPRGATKR
jgi:Fur family transcriptional regulator, stress-responsive regulator